MTTAEKIKEIALYMNDRRSVFDYRKIQKYYDQAAGSVPFHGNAEMLEYIYSDEFAPYDLGYVAFKQTPVGQRINASNRDTAVRIGVEGYLFFRFEKTLCVYDFDDTLSEELIKTPIDGTIPASVIRKLPFNTFFVSTNKYNAYFKDESNLDYLKHFHNASKRSELECLGFLFMIDEFAGRSYLTISPLGKSPKGNIAFIPQTIPIVESENNEISLQNCVDVHVSTLKIKLPQINEEAEKSIMRQSIYAAMPFLYYLASENAEIHDCEHRTLAKGQINIKNSNFQKKEVGKDFGIRVRNFREEQKKLKSTGLGNTVSPHVRRAHWHHYWVGGKENKNIILHWIEPVYIHKDMQLKNFSHVKM